MESGLICLVPCTEFRANLNGFELSRTRINRSDGDSHRPARALPSSFSGSAGFSQIHLDSKRGRQLHWISILSAKATRRTVLAAPVRLTNSESNGDQKVLRVQLDKNLHEEVPFCTRSLEACLPVRRLSEPWPSGRVPCANEESGRLSCRAFPGCATILGENSILPTYH